MQEKTARPRAFCSIRGGICFITYNGSVAGEDASVDSVGDGGVEDEVSNARNPSMQKDFNILAALLHSRSRVVGQYVSRLYWANGAKALSLAAVLAAAAAAPVLLRLPGAIFPAHPKTLPRASGEVVLAAVVGDVALFGLDRSHEGSRAETRCMAGS